MYLMKKRTDEATKKGREQLNGLPRHVARVKLPSGKSLGEMNYAELARICIVLEIPETGFEAGKLRNAELLIEHLENIGQRAAEAAISEHLKSKLGGAEP